MRTEKLFKTPLTETQQRNSELNHQEFVAGKALLESYPRRIVFELTNRCNFRCIMCGREAAVFKTYDLPLPVIRRFEPCFPYIEEVTLHGWGEGTLHPHFVSILELLNRHPLLRKYFVTNGSTLARLTPAIFEHHVDLVAISLDGATAATNDSIRRGGDFGREMASLKNLLAERRRRNLDYPYVNFVFTAMRRNIHELPDQVGLAADLGLPEVKVVYLTVFKQSLRQDSLLGQQELIREVFAAAQERAQALNINLKLPEIQGEGEAGTRRHKPCAFPWRDLYIGSDEYLRPCQSSAQKIVHISEHQDFRALWNCEQMQELRRRVNDDDSMSEHCHNCYHSTCANWNLPHTFIHSDHLFAPEWTTDKNTSTARG